MVHPCPGAVLIIEHSVSEGCLLSERACSHREDAARGLCSEASGV